jgi:hypothetical protein
MRSLSKSPYDEIIGIVKRLEAARSGQDERPSTTGRKRNPEEERLRNLKHHMGNSSGFHRRPTIPGENFTDRRMRLLR